MTDDFPLLERRHNNMSRLFIINVAMAVALCVGTIMLAGTLALLVKTHEQSQRNQLHIDCVVSVFVHTDPPKCRLLKKQLENNGIFPTKEPTP
jgi:hypothetical protein